MKKNVVYKAVFGNYDSIDSINEDYVNDSTDYIFISDLDIELPTPWKLRKVERQFSSHVKENRFYKMNGIPEFTTYDLSIYLDGNVNIIGDITHLLDNLDPNFEMHAYRHPKRNSIRDELKACVIYNKISIAQYKESNEEKYEPFKNTNQDMYECNILIRKTNSEKLSKSMENWFELFCSNIPRDQIYFPYILEKHHIAINSLGISNIRSDSEYFSIKAHTHKTRWVDRKKVLLYKKLNKLLKWL